MMTCNGSGSYVRAALLAVLAVITMLLLLASPASAAHYTITPGETQARDFDGSDTIRFDAKAGSVYEVDVRITSWLGVVDSISVVVRRPTGGALGTGWATQGYPGIALFKAPADETLDIELEQVNWMSLGPRGYSITLREIQHCTITGTARDAVTQEPLAGMDVRLYRVDQGSQPSFVSQVRTASDGTYSFAVDFPSSYTLQYVDPTGARQGRFLGGQTDEFWVLAGVGGPELLAFEAGHTYADVDGFLALPWTLDSVVRRHDGTPVPYAQVKLHPMQFNGYYAVWDSEVTADANGRVTFTKPGFTSMLLSVTDPEGACPPQFVGGAFHIQDPGSTVIDPEPGSTYSQDLVLVQGGTFSGRLIERSTGSGMMYKLVSVWRKTAEQGWQQVAEVPADKAGRFQFPVMLPGDYRVRVPFDYTTTPWRTDWYTSDTVADVRVTPGNAVSADFTVAAGADVRPVVTVSTRRLDAARGAVLAGNVQAAGIPVAAAAVKLQSSTDRSTWKDAGTAVTDAAGGYRFTVNPTKATYYRVTATPSARFEQATGSRVLVVPTVTPTQRFRQRTWWTL